MNSSMNLLFACAAALALPGHAAQNGCPEGSYRVVVAPDHSTLSILFDRFEVRGGPAAAQPAGQATSKVCHVSHALKLPPNTSLGVYKVDYRGFAKLAPGQEASLDVQYALSPKGNEHGRVFRRKVKGAHEDDFIFTENIGAGQMKRAGCGADARLNVRVELGLAGGPEDMVSLDSADGASAAMVYHLRLKPCRA